MVTITDNKAAKDVYTAKEVGFALSKSGDLYSWGFGEMSQLASRKGGDETCPTLVEAVTEQHAVLGAAAGAQHSVYVVMPRPDSTPRLRVAAHGGWVGTCAVLKARDRHRAEARRSWSTSTKRRHRREKRLHLELYRGSAAVRRESVGEGKVWVR